MLLVFFWLRPASTRPMCAECRTLQSGEVLLPDRSVLSQRSPMVDTLFETAFVPLHSQLQVLGALDVIPRARTGQLLCTLYARCESSTRKLECGAYRAV